MTTGELTRIDERRAFWDEASRWERNCLAIQEPYKSIPGWEGLICGKSVLEIGPGDGRQFLTLSALAGRYAIADISPRVLGHELYRNVPRYRIDGYDTFAAPELFHTITFWYVIHHVLVDEAPELMAAARRHLRPGGSLLFNAPDCALEAEYLSERAGDGFKTTPWDRATLERVLGDNGFAVRHWVELAANCVAIHAELRS